MLSFRHDRFAQSRIGAASFFAALFVASAFLRADAPPIGPDEGRPHVQWLDAGKVLGRVAHVTGQIVDIGGTANIRFLNFSKDNKQRDEFKVVIYDRYKKEFPESLEDAYLNKYVTVHGIVTEYGGKPQIQATSSAQIQVLDAAPDTPRWQDPAPQPASDVITIASYNVKNIFDADDSPYYNDETTPAKPRAELEPLAAVIHELNADVLALQETENRGYLERYVEVFLSDMNYRNIVHFEGNDRRCSNVALLSRLPVGPVTSHRHLTFTDPAGRSRRVERDLLEVRIEPPDGDPFDIWVVHLKSNFDGKTVAEPIRVGEAVTLRKLLDQSLDRDPRARFVVCGDFNDVFDSPALRAVVGAGDHALKSFFTDIPEDKRITYNRQPYLSMIDFILASPAMAERYVANSYSVLSGDRELAASDHNPSLAKFRIKGSATSAAMTGKSESPQK